VYLYTRILALFSAVPYVEPGTNLGSHGKDSPVNMAPHLTNTSLQGHHSEDNVLLLEELIDCSILSGGLADDMKLTAKDVTDIVYQIVDTLAETFKAGLETPIHFQVGCLFHSHVSVLFTCNSHCPMLSNFMGLIFWLNTRLHQAQDGRIK